MSDSDNNAAEVQRLRKQVTAFQNLVDELTKSWKVDDYMESAAYNGGRLRCAEELEKRARKVLGR